MKKIILSVFVLFCGLTLSWLPAADQTAGEVLDWHRVQPQPIQSRVETAVGMLLSEAHYKKREIDDTLSSQMFDSYLKFLDSGKYYLLQSDIDEFEKYRFKFDDAIKAGDLSGAFFIYNRFQDRLRSRHEFVQGLLDKDFDFTVDEYVDTDREDKPWAATESDLDEIWRKRIKNEVLSLRLAGKKPEDTVETLKKRYENISRRISQTDSEDVLNLYLNALAENFDPHTGYMSPQSSDDFKIRMSKSLEGIGATLQTEDEYTKVIEIVTGGPADKSGLLHPNDRIVGVGQGDDGDMVDVIGWRIEDVVELIRGPKGSKVRLQIIPADASVYAEPENIEIIRDKVKLADRMAKSRIQEVPYQGRNFKIGIIEIPDFYFDSEAMQSGDPDYATTSGDVQKFLADMKAASVDGVVIDLRENGGGFLSEAIKLTGLFIKKGPVVQVRGSRGDISEQNDKDPKEYYDGPLAVIVDGLSASASEIFAAAIQDYGRGIIVGSPTFGKGTVQSIIPLDRVLPESKEALGQLRLTIAKFYRVTGSSTQHVGVTPDFQFPSRDRAMDIGENSYKTALLWDQIARTNYDPSSNPIRKFIPDLDRKFESRLKDNPEFHFLQEDIKQIQEQKENTLVSLQQSKREKEKAEAEARSKEREKELKESGADEDLFLAETEHILGDYLMMARPAATAARP